MNKVAAFALRRKALVFERERTEHRITPAYAGKSHHSRSGSAARRDHPRVCGEKTMACSILRPMRGSPPRVRGKARDGAVHILELGITPAYAGKSGGLPCRVHRRGDHPRVCGEKFERSDPRFPSRESPPRMRGKAIFSSGSSGLVGITPACAGKSPVFFCRTVCRLGSPPRVRGKVRSFSAARSAASDHPRVCGEKLRIVEVGRVKEGSPPRVRGKVAPHLLSSCVSGITPACAGKSLDSRTVCRRLRDHPRVCGEKFHPASDRKLGRVQGTKRSSGPAPAAAPAGLAGSCPASPPWSYPPRITVSRPRP